MNWMNEEAKNISIKFTKEQRKIAEETKKTWGGWWTFLTPDPKTGGFTLHLVEMYKPWRRNQEEIAEDLKIENEMRQCGGLFPYLAKKLKDDAPTPY